VEEFRKIIENSMKDMSLIKITISQPIQKGNQLRRVFAAPIQLRNQIYYQLSLQEEKRELHENIESDALIARLTELATHFRQAFVQTTYENYQVFFNRKGIHVLKQKSNMKAPAALDHDRKKNYIIPEGIAAPFFVELGVMTPDGVVVKSKYDKFRQINRYLEFLRDILIYLPKIGPLRVVDFGCGKSYLTFAAYYYLHDIQGREVEMIGLDLKEDVIQFCNQVALRCRMSGLRFEVGNIESYESTLPIDMVISLHACDTATDAALAQAVRWGSKVIMAVPCCQHEINAQMKSRNVAAMQRYGIIQERLASLITDTARAELLSFCGYRTQIVEFIDMEHTPKNLLIRSILSPNSNREQGLQEYLELKNEFQFEFAFEKLLIKQGISLDKKSLI